MKYYCFVEFEPENIDSVLSGDVPQAIQAAENGNMKPLKDLYMNGRIEITSTTYKRGGWAFPIAHLVKTYWVKTTNGRIYEVYAPNKICIQKKIGHWGIAKIVEV